MPQASITYSRRHLLDIPRWQLSRYSVVEIGFIFGTKLINLCVTIPFGFGLCKTWQWYWNKILNFIDFEWMFNSCNVILLFRSLEYRRTQFPFHTHNMHIFLNIRNTHVNVMEKKSFTYKIKASRINIYTF